MSRTDTPTGHNFLIIHTDPRRPILAVVDSTAGATPSE